MAEALSTDGVATDLNDSDMTPLSKGEPGGNIEAMAQPQEGAETTEDLLVAYSMLAATIKLLRGWSQYYRNQQMSALAEGNERTGLSMLENLITARGGEMSVQRVNRELDTSRLEPNGSKIYRGSVS